MRSGRIAVSRVMASFTELIGTTNLRRELAEVVIKGSLVSPSTITQICRVTLHNVVGIPSAANMLSLYQVDVLLAIAAPGNVHYLTGSIKEPL